MLDHLAVHIQQHGLGADGVLLHRDGVPFDSAKFGYELRAARRRAGLPESITFHDLRHFFASALIHAGCSVKQVQAALGHKSAKVTLDVYGHLGPARKTESATPSDASSDPTSCAAHKAESPSAFGVDIIFDVMHRRPTLPPRPNG